MDERSNTTLRGTRNGPCDLHRRTQIRVLRKSVGIGIEARGTCTTSCEVVLEKMKSIVVWPDQTLTLKHRVAASDNTEQAYFSAHPAAPDIELKTIRAEVELLIPTTTVGPGYHVWAVSMLDALREHITWHEVVDDGDYWSSRDRDALERAFLAWLRGTLQTLLQKSKEGFVGFAISLPVDVRFFFPAFLLTPLGPRDENWATRALADDELASSHFPWWRDFDAHFYLRIALVRMWCDLPFRSCFSESEERDVQTTLSELEQAFTLDSTLPYPWVEWAQLFSIAGEESLRATRTQLRALQSATEEDHNAAAIGYRRGEVEQDVGGGFRLKVPGTLASRWEREGTTLVLWDETHSLWITTMTHDGDPEAVLADLSRTAAQHDDEAEPAQEYGFDKELREGHALRGGLRLRAAAAANAPENTTANAAAEDTPDEALSGEAWAVFGKHAALATFVSKNPHDGEWLLNTWATLVHSE